MDEMTRNQEMTQDHAEVAYWDTLGNGDSLEKAQDAFYQIMGDSGLTTAEIEEVRVECGYPWDISEGEWDDSDAQDLDDDNGDDEDFYDED